MSEVEAFILELEGKQYEICSFLNGLITSYPKVTSKISYKIPFYHQKSWVCYLNPIKPDKVELAFTRADELSNEQGLLDFKNRKQIAGITFSSVGEIDKHLLNEILQEALLLDEAVPYKSKRAKS